MLKRLKPRIEDQALFATEQQIDRLLQNHLTLRMQHGEHSQHEAEERQGKHDKRRKAERTLDEARLLVGGGYSVHRKGPPDWGLAQRISRVDLTMSELCELDRILDGAFEHTPKEEELERRIEAAGEFFVRCFDSMPPAAKEMLTAHVLLFGPRDTYASLVARGATQNEETAARAHLVHAEYLETAAGQRIVEEARKLGLTFTPAKPG
jgi:hypothetical protein